MKKLTVTLLSLALVALPLPTFAKDASRTVSTHTTTSGSWAVQALGLNQTPTNTAYTITWGVAGGTAYSYFVFRNTGTFTVNGFTVDVTQTQIGGSGKPSDTTFYLCSNGTWNVTTNLCSGTTSLIGSSADLVLAFNNISLNSGADLNVQATTKPSLKNASTTTLSVSINRTQIRSAQIFNS
jgi:hypothetical protein